MEPLVALSWAYWQRGWHWFLLTSLGCTALPTLIFSSMLAEGVRATDDPLANRTIYVSMFIHSAGLMVFVALYVPGRLSQYDTLPVSLYRLIGCKMTHAAVAAGLMYTVMASALNLVFDVGWPILGPALFTAVLTMVLGAAVWSLRGFLLAQIVAVATLGTMMALWVAARYSIDASKLPAVPQRMWETVRFDEVLTLCAMGALAYTLATISVSRRQLDRASVAAKFWDACERLAPPWRERKALRSAEWAQFCFEWRRRGFAVVVVQISFCVAAILFCVSPWVHVGDGRAIITGFSGLTAIVLALLGFYLGHRSKTMQLGSFEASRPLSDSQIAKPILQVTAVCCLSGVALWGLTVALFQDWLAINPRSGSSFASWLGLDWRQAATHLAQLIIAAWTIMSIAAVLGLVRKWFLILLFWGMMAFVVCQIMAFRIFVPARYVHQLTEINFAACGIAFALMTLGMYLQALRRKLIRPWVAVVAAATWGLMTRIFGPEASGAFLVGLSALPVLAMAAGPLAVHWNRHR